MSKTCHYLVTVYDVGNITGEADAIHTILTSTDHIAPRNRVTVTAVADDAILSTINLDDEALFTAVCGAGASQWGWYYEFDPDFDALKVKVTLDNGNDGRESATLTPGSLRRTVSAMCANRVAPSVADVRWSDPECDSDIDACIADCIIQYAVLGDVVFG